jgi:PIN domain nuclease of toxin-antitoxin system
MKYLLDTHVLIWALKDSALVPPKVRRLLVDRANQVLVSAVSAYEIEYKRPRSEDLQNLPADLNDGVASLEFEWLPLTYEHAVLAGRLPRLHRDPFDRLIVAQALTEQATIVTSDSWVAAYGAPVVG